MNDTRAKSAAETQAKAIQNVANAAKREPAATPADEPTTIFAEVARMASAPKPLKDAPPLLLRLEPSLWFTNDEQHTLQPRLGASVVVGDSVMGRESTGTRSMWLSADVLEGIGVIVRQTPAWHRQNVAAFLRVLESVMTREDVVGGLLNEVIREVENDPYRAVPESKVDEYDFNW